MGRINIARSVLTLLLILAVGSQPLLAGIFVLPSGMVDIYQENRRLGIPNYITEDFLLRGYGLLLETGIAEMEAKRALPEFRELLDGLHADFAGASGEAAQANRRYVATLRALLMGEESTGDLALDAELAAVRAAEGIARSQLFRQTIDYTQFRPRGKYAATPEMSRYFQAMRLAGAVLFPVKESAATGITAETADALTAQAMDLADRITRSPAVAQTNQRLMQRLTWVFGPAEDLGIDDLLPQAEETPAAARVRLLSKARQERKQPRILGGVVDVGKLEEGVSAADALTGFRLLPSRFTPDSAALQALVYNSVTDYRGKGEPFTLTVLDGRRVKGFPRAAELMAILDSREADRQLKGDGDLNYTGYAEARERAAALLQEDAGLVSLHLQLIEYLVRGDTRNDGARRLNTALSFYTMHRHANILYAKQSYTAAGKGMQSHPVRGAPTIDAEPELFLLLSRLTSRAATELESPALAEYALLLDDCIDAAFRVRDASPLTARQTQVLNDLDEELVRHAGAEDAPIVTDIHTDPNTRQVVQEGLAHPEVVSLGKAKGARFVHREFKQPMEQRLTDEEWSQQLQREERAR